MKENLLGVLNVEFAIKAGIFVLISFIGALISLFLGALLHKYFSKKITKWSLKKELPEVVEHYKRSLRFVIWIFQFFILFVFFFIGSEVLGIEKLSIFFIGILKYFPLIFMAVILFIFSLSLGKILSSKVAHLNIEHAPAVSFFVEFILIYASILTVLEFFKISASPFFEIFKVILYVAGAIVAIAVGIPVGLSIKESLEKNAKKKN
jgi:hypothetical protein